MTKLIVAFRNFANAPDRGGGGNNNNYNKDNNNSEST